MLKYIIIGLVILAVIFLLIRAFSRPPREIGRGNTKTTAPDDDAVAAEIDGQELDIDPAVLDEVRRLCDSGRKIEAIKHLCEATGLDLTKAKDVVESLEQLRAK